MYVRTYRAVGWAGGGGDDIAGALQPPAQPWVGRYDLANALIEKDVPEFWFGGKSYKTLPTTLVAAFYGTLFLFPKDVLKAVKIMCQNFGLGAKVTKLCRPPSWRLFMAHYFYFPRILGFGSPRLRRSATAARHRLHRRLCHAGAVGEVQLLQLRADRRPPQQLLGLYSVVKRMLWRHCSIQVSSD